MNLATTAGARTRRSLLSRLLTSTTLLLTLGSAPAPAQTGSEPLPPEETWIPFDPVDQQLTLVRGANYIPGFTTSSVAILSPHFVQHLPQIEADLWTMRQAGVNTIRFWLNFWTWAEDPAYYLAALDFVFDRCEQWGLRVIPVLWDGLFEPTLQCTPSCPLQAPCLRPFQIVTTPHLQFGSWLPNPGAAYIFYPELRPLYDPWFQLYVAQVVTALHNRSALLLWDVMNEPISGCWPELDQWLSSNITQVRAIDPTTPITVGIALPQHVTQSLASQLDVVTFHPYTTLQEGFTTLLTQARQLANGKPVLATEGLGGPGHGQRYEDFLRYAVQAQCGFTLFEAMAHTNLAYPYILGTGFLYADGTTRDLPTVQAFQALAATQGGYVGRTFVQKASNTPGWVPFWPLGDFAWTGVGGPEIVSLLRNWTAQFGTTYPVLDGSTSPQYRHIVVTILGDLVALGVPTAAEQAAFATDLVKFDDAMGQQPPDVVLGKQHLEAMKDLLVTLMGPTRANLGNQ